MSVACFCVLPGHVAIPQANTGFTLYVLFLNPLYSHSNASPRVIVCISGFLLLADVRPGSVINLQAAQQLIGQTMALIC